MSFVWNQAADFEEGDLTDYDSVVGGADVTADVAALRHGNYGMQIVISDTSNRHGLFTGPAVETIVTVEFDFNPNLITMATNDAFNIVSDGSDFFIQLKWNGSNYQVRVAVRNDGGTLDPSSFVTITDDWHQIRVTWKASSGVGADDGFHHLSIDDILQEAVSGLDNDTIVIDAMRFGANGLDAGTSGYIYFDNCRWSDDTLITFANPLVMLAALPAPTAIIRFVQRLHARYRDTRFTAAQRDFSLTARNRDTRLTTERKK